MFEHKEIAEHLNKNPTTISKHMRDPVFNAWMSGEVHKTIGQRLGQIDAAMFNRAVGGNVPAAKLMYDRYQEITKRIEMSVRHEHQMDVTKLTDAQLEALMKDKNLIDTEYTELPDGSS